MLAQQLKWPTEAETPSPWAPIVVPQHHQHQLSTSLSEALLFEHDADSDGEADGEAAAQQQEDDACSEASGHSLHFNFDDAPHTSVQTPATFRAWAASGSDDEQDTSAAMRMVSSSTVDEALHAALSPRSPDAHAYLSTTSSAAAQHIAPRAPARSLSTGAQPTAAAAAAPMPFARWDEELPPSSRPSAILSAADAPSFDAFADGSFARSCPRPISMPIKASRPGHTHKPSNDALDALFVPPHLVSASNVLDAGRDGGGFGAGFGASGSVQNPSSMRLRGSQMVKLRAGVLRSTGYFEGYTEMGVSARGGSSIACGRGGFL